MFWTALQFVRDTFVSYFLPLMIVYQSCVCDPFLNVECEEGSALEKVGDTLLTPYRYVFVGRRAVRREDGFWHFENRFDYSELFWLKNVASWAVTPLSLATGGLVKALAFLSPEVRERYRSFKKPQPLYRNDAYYREIGLFPQPISEEKLICQGHQRRPGDERHLSVEKEALAAISKALTEAHLIWWVDCGTCLGTYRYGGVIPWDCDIDIAVLELDFENVLWVLRAALDPQKYIVWDMSTRDHPDSSIKVFIRSTQTQIDLYHYRIYPETRTLRYVLSQESLIFMPEWWKSRELPFTAAVAFEDLFPLKRGFFDGIEVFVPRHTKKYLTRVYGEDLSPTKIYNPKTGRYERDLSHPYWQKPIAH